MFYLKLTKTDISCTCSKTISNKIRKKERKKQTTTTTFDVDKYNAKLTISNDKLVTKWFYYKKRTEM